ncbi:hypothetical protein AB0N09_36040 [Streptomyces erythrochromogenes]|uniref:hypothetical protein n=1 Tax=Streptomyces erythrochromogenes TaxID=285574 RepID=UPI0034197FE5
MVTEVLRRWRVQRGVRGAVVRTRTVLPSGFCATALTVPAPAAPTALDLGGDELRVRAWLAARLDGGAL